MTQTQPHTCGTLALVHMALALKLVRIDSMDEIDQLHAWLLSQQIESTIFGSGQAEVLQQLADLLATKGIPNLGTFERAQLVLNKLGLTQVGNIMRGKNVWAALKAAASRPGHLFRLVTADERAGICCQAYQNQAWCPRIQPSVKKVSQASQISWANPY